MKRRKNTRVKRSKNNPLWILLILLTVVAIVLMLKASNLEKRYSQPKTQFGLAGWPTIAPTGSWTLIKKLPFWKTETVLSLSEQVSYLSKIERNSKFIFYIQDGNVHSFNLYTGDSNKIVDADYLQSLMPDGIGKEVGLILKVLDNENLFIFTGGMGERALFRVELDSDNYQVAYMGLYNNISKAGDMYLLTEYTYYGETVRERYYALDSDAKTTRLIHSPQGNVATFGALSDKVIGVDTKQRLLVTYYTNGKGTKENYSYIGSGGPIKRNFYNVTAISLRNPNDKETVISNAQILKDAQNIILDKNADSLIISGVKSYKYSLNDKNLKEIPQPTPSDPTPDFDKFLKEDIKSIKLPTGYEFVFR